MRYAMLVVGTGGSSLNYKSKKFLRAKRVVFRIDAERAEDAGKKACEIIEFLLKPGNVGSPQVRRNLLSIQHKLLKSEGDARWVEYGKGEADLVWYRWFPYQLSSIDKNSFDFNVIAGVFPDKETT